MTVTAWLLIALLLLSGVMVAWAALTLDGPPLPATEPATERPWADAELAAYPPQAEALSSRMRERDAADVAP